MSATRVGGIIFISVNGERYSAKGDWEYSTGTPVRTAVVGADEVHGFMEKPMAPYISGEITDRGDINYNELGNLRDAVVVLELANGRIMTLQDAWFSGELVGKTAEGNLSVRFEGLNADLI